MLGPVILVFGRDLLSIVLLLLASGIDDKGTGLMASRFGAGKQESDLLENLGKKYQQNPDAFCQKRKHSRWKPARNLLFYTFSSCYCNKSCFVLSATKDQVQLFSLGSYCGPKLSFQKMGRGAATLPFEARQVGWYILGCSEVANGVVSIDTSIYVAVVVSI